MRVVKPRRFGKNLGLLFAFLPPHEGPNEPSCSVLELVRVWLGPLCSRENQRISNAAVSAQAQRLRFFF